MKALATIKLFTLSAVLFSTLSGGSALASVSKTEAKEVSRMEAVNRALEKALLERAQSHQEFERNEKADRFATRRKNNEREAFEESRREKRLNWLHD